jgi:hypothetical protein
MFLKHVGPATNLKKIVYVTASTILGLLLSLIAHAVIEINYIKWLLGNSKEIVFYGSCTLTPILQASIWLIGLVFGFLLGLFWWQKIYIERLWSKK